MSETGQQQEGSSGQLQPQQQQEGLPGGVIPDIMQPPGEHRTSTSPQQHGGSHQQSPPLLQLSDRPWGWWRGAGAPLLAGLDAVRPPLLQLHSTGAPDSSSSSPALLRALGRPSSPQHSPAASAGAVLHEAWQHLVSAEQDRRNTAAPAQGQQPAAELPVQQPAGLSPQQQPGHAAAQQQLLSLPQPQQQQQQERVHQPEQAAPHVSQAGAALASAAAGSSAGRRPAAAAAAAASKPPKRPWQPKMQPDEPTWDKVRTDTQDNRQAACDASLTLRELRSHVWRTRAPPRTLYARRHCAAGGVVLTAGSGAPPLQTPRLEFLVSVYC